MIKCACKQHTVADVSEVKLTRSGTHSASVCAWRDDDDIFRTAGRTALAVEALRDKTVNYKEDANERS